MYYFFNDTQIDEISYKTRMYDKFDIIFDR